MPETKLSQPDKVDAYMNGFNHPLKVVLAALREIILGVSKEIGEEVKWNAPAFFYTGPMEPSDPKLYKRYIVVANVHYQDRIVLVLMQGEGIDDGSGFFEGKYTDGRRLISFYSIDEVEQKKEKLQQVVRTLLKTMID